MASQAVAGFRGFLLTSTATGQAKNKIAELMDFTVNTEHAEIDVTSHDSSGTREIISGIDQWSATGEMLHVMTEETHQELYDVMVGKTLVDFEFIPTGSSSDGSYSGTGFVSGFEVNAPMDGALGANLTITGSGALVRNSSST